MQLVRCGDVHDIDRGIVDERAPIAHRAREPVSCSGREGEFLGGIGQQLQDRLQRQIEHRADAAEAQRMGAAHEAGTNEANADWLFHYDLSPGT